MVGIEMDKNVYVLYDNKIETTESLEKFKKILVLAGFEDAVIKPVSSEEYNNILVENNYNFYNFVIAINQTYKQINQIYSDKLNVPIFDFFSKEYTNREKSLVLYGLLFSISSIYEPAYKKFSWSVVQKFFTDYSDTINQTNTEEDCDYLSNDTPVSNKVENIFEVQPTTEVIDEDTTEESEIVSSVEISIEQTPHVSETFQAVHQEEELSYEELVSFYINTKSLISQFNKVQDQIRIIESYNETV